MTRERPYAMPKALRWAVFSRDRQCVLATLEPGHVCKDIWGQVHAPNDFDRLSIEHVKLELGMSVPRIHDLQHCLTLCAFANVNVPSKVQRAMFRAYLRVWEMFGTVFQQGQWQAYLSTPAPIFNGESAGSLIAAGRSEEVLASLDQLRSGAFV